MGKRRPEGLSHAEIVEHFACPEPTTGCLLWTGFHRANGYGQVTINGIAHKAHRLAWETAHGPIPAGMCVCHKCDTRACVNTDHMFLGTKADNSRDMHMKGRSRPPLGEASARAKLTNDNVRFIRSQHALGASIRGLARRFGVDNSVVRDVVRRLSWKHVP